MENLGCYQDGGLRHNNPINIALWECKKIWPQVTQNEVDYVVSLGTGTCAPIDASTTHNSSNGSSWKDLFILRLYRSLMASMDGQKIWTELRNQLPEGNIDRYFRLNVQFKGREPQLDDIKSMHQLNRIKPSRFVHTSLMTDLVETMLANQFFLELTRLPTYQGGVYSCAARIKTRLPNEHGRVVWRFLKSMRMSFHLDDQMILSETGYSIMGVNEDCMFTVKGLQQSISVIAHGTDVFRNGRAISGFPTTISAMISNQGLNAVFGTRTHSKRLRSYQLELPRPPPKRQCIRQVLPTIVENLSS